MDGVNPAEQKVLAGKQSLFKLRGRLFKATVVEKISYEVEHHLLAVMQIKSQVIVIEVKLFKALFLPFPFVCEKGNGRFSEFFKGDVCAVVQPVSVKLTYCVMDCNASD